MHLEVIQAHSSRFTQMVQIRPKDVWYVYMWEIMSVGRSIKLDIQHRKFPNTHMEKHFYNISSELYLQVTSNLIICTPIK